MAKHLTITYCKFVKQCASERIFTIGQYLFWQRSTKIRLHIFVAHGVVVVVVVVVSGSRTAWLVSIVPWERTPWVVRQLWRVTDGVSGQRVAWTLLRQCCCCYILMSSELKF